MSNPVTDFTQWRKKLDETLAKIEDPQKLVGQHVPFWAQDWAERNGLDVQQTRFAPPGKLYIIGAVPVPEPGFDSLFHTEAA